MSKSKLLWKAGDYVECPDYVSDPCYYTCPPDKDNQEVR